VIPKLVLLQCQPEMLLLIDYVWINCYVGISFVHVQDLCAKTSICCMLVVVYISRAKQVSVACWSWFTSVGPNRYLLHVGRGLHQSGQTSICCMLVVVYLSRVSSSFSSQSVHCVLHTELSLQFGCKENGGRKMSRRKHREQNCRIKTWQQLELARQGK
jgi:hypothetical protein